MEQANETRKRSLLKAISWRVIATIITMCATYVITGRMDFALEVGLLDTGVKIFAYYAHERAWAHTKL